ncbi:MAG: tRNA (N6-threonylcarbamoyladenosine(37)-N6)-methyltransferase TrmO [Ruminococcus sp.]
MKNKIETIAHIENDFTEKFGVPRQSGMADTIISKIVFEPKYRVLEAFRGLDEFSYIWILWLFSKANTDDWSPTVRPPILGGNKRMGVFATRSPFRPNSIGMSSVKIHSIDINSKDGPIIYVQGADLMNGTPIIDIKPYLPFTDSHPEATGGFTDYSKKENLKVIIPDNLQKTIPDAKLQSLKSLLQLDPRPAYQNDPGRVYKMSFGEYEVHFSVDNTTLTVLSIN